jgi:hypothetical protein
MRHTVPVWLLAEDEFGTGHTVCRRTRGCLKLLDLVVAMIVHQMILRQAEALSRFEQDERIGQLELVIRPAQPPLCVGDGVRLAKCSTVVPFAGTAGRSSTHFSPPAATLNTQRKGAYSSQRQAGSQQLHSRRFTSPA